MSEDMEIVWREDNRIYLRIGETAHYLNLDQADQLFCLLREFYGE